MVYVLLGRERICEGLDSFVCEFEFWYINVSYEFVFGFSNFIYLLNLNILEIRVCYYEVWVFGLKRLFKFLNFGNLYFLKVD